MSKLQLISFAAAVVSAVVFPGCEPSGPNYLVVNRAWETGDVDAASEEIQKDATPDAVADADEPLLWMLNAGLIAGLAGDYAAGTNYLGYARGEVEAGLMRGGDRSVLDALSATVSGKYECSAQEAGMIPVLQIYNALGGSSKADVYPCALSVDVFSRDVEASFATRIYALETAAKKRQTFDLRDEKGSAIKGGSGSYCPADEVASAVNWTDFYGGEEIDMNAKFDRASAEWLFFNPFTYWLGAAVLMNAPRDADDFEVASKYLEKAVQLTNGESEFLNREFSVAAEKKKNPTAAFESNPNVTYVICEGGRAPVVYGKPTEVKVPIVVRAVADALIGAIAQLGAAGEVLPKSGTAYLPVAASRGKSPEVAVNGELPDILVDFDVILDETLRTEMPSNASSALIGVVTGYAARAGALIGAGLLKQYAAQNPGDKWAAATADLALSGALAFAATPIELDRPDSRSWSFLPRTLEVTRMATPRTGKLKIGDEEISVPARGVNFVRVRKVNDYWPATVQVFPLDPASEEIVPTLRLKAKPRGGSSARGSE